MAAGPAHGSSSSGGIRKHFPAERRAARTSAIRAEAESGPRVRTLGEAREETLFRIAANAYHFQADQRRSSPCLSSRGVQQRAGELLQRRRPNMRRVARKTG